MIVLDTSYLIDFFRGERRTLEIMNSDVATTVVTYYEILSGIGHKNDFFTKNRVKTALRAGLAIYFFADENGA